MREWFNSHTVRFAKNKNENMIWSSWLKIKKTFFSILCLYEVWIFFSFNIERHVRELPIDKNSKIINFVSWIIFAKLWPIKSMNLTSDTIAGYVIDFWMSSVYSSFLCTLFQYIAKYRTLNMNSKSRLKSHFAALLHRKMLKVTVIRV